MLVPREGSSRSLLLTQKPLTESQGTCETPRLQNKELGAFLCPLLLLCPLFMVCTYIQSSLMTCIGVKKLPHGRVAVPALMPIKFENDMYVIGILPH